MIANNTVVGVPGMGLTLYFGEVDDIQNLYVVNNILTNCARYAGQCVLSVGTGKYNWSSGSWGDDVDVVIDYNIISNGAAGATNISHKGTWYDGSNYEGWKTASGCQDHVIGKPDPSLDVDYKAASGDPPIDGGVALSTWFTTDLEGTNRPQSVAWDIGCYEGLGAGDPPAPGVPPSFVLNAATNALCWGVPTGTVYYFVVYASDVPNPTVTGGAVGIPSETYSFPLTGLQHGRAYYFAVVAVGYNATSDPSPDIFFRTDAAQTKGAFTPK